jgi:PAS domain S-box-containing protein
MSDLHRKPLRYVLAAAIIALAFLLRWAMVEAVGEIPPFITLYPAVMLVGLLVGLGPGLLATILAALAADYWLIASRGSFLIGSPANVVSLGLFSLMGVLTSVVAELYRRAVEREAVYQQKLALRESEERLRLAVEATGCGTYTYDFSSAEGYWSPELKALYGLHADEPLPLDADSVPLAVHPDDRPAFLAAMRAANDPRGSGILRLDYRIIRPDRSTRWLHVHGHTDLEGQSADGRPRRAAGIVVDITERKGAEQEKLEMQRRLLHAQKLESIGILAGGIAHDFNNILAGIMGYADLALLRLSESEPAREDIEVIKNSVRRAADLTRQMLAYAGKGTSYVEPVSLSQVVDDCKKMLTMSLSKKATVTYDLAPDLPATLADASQVYQVVLNLVMNASDALGEQSGTITISTAAIHCRQVDLADVACGSDLREGLYVRLEVTDTGCGMAPETLGKIFDPFFTTKFTGRGLGLASVQGIVLGHQGAIRVVSQPGKGTRFQVLFPASGATQTLGSAESVATAPRRGDGAVLIVDDKDAVRETPRVL